jgi:hypothetical protein
MNDSVFLVFPFDNPNSSICNSILHQCFFFLSQNMGHFFYFVFPDTFAPLSVSNTAIASIYEVSHRSWKFFRIFGTSLFIGVSVTQKFLSLCSNSRQNNKWTKAQASRMCYNLCRFNISQQAAVAWIFSKAAGQWIHIIYNCSSDRELSIICGHGEAARGIKL